MNDRVLLLTRRTLAGLSLFLLAGSSACSRCSAVDTCEGDNYLAADGQIVEMSGKAGKDGVRVEVVRSGGIDATPDSVSVITGGGGFWHVEFTPASAGVMTANITVAVDGVVPYVLHDVRLQTKPHRGDGNLNERWVPALFLNYIGEFFLGGTLDQRVAGAIVTFRQTGGPPLVGTGVHGGVVAETTDMVGRVPIFPRSGSSAANPSGDSAVVGTFTIRRPGVKDSTLVRDVHLTPSWTVIDEASYPPVLRYPVP